ncbi:hypothetical protein ACFOQM_01155 [Paenibacillus sp. GCM10012307]|uniref:RAMP superfamily protein n=1 Tax=Paenibacillus roseus TaxID=2798579 RepID=A0A934J317_9BACL|nr:hypothetical protein [Paenibacillus roseus]MBJ6359931.1 hypothetical protein [Paenibacillus roseus]
MNYQVVQIINKEPLKIGAGGSKSGPTEPCKDYIPGSTIRGAMISAMLRLGICDEASLAPVLQGMSCYNAYPYQRGSLYFPVPQHLRVNKHEWRKAKINPNLHPALKLTNLIEEQNPEFKNSPEFRFVAIQQEGLHGIHVAKAYTLHHSKSLNFDQKEKENLFSYQAIVPGQTFRAIIAYEDDVAASVNSTLQQLRDCYLGGSKGSGYGLSYVEKIGDATTVYSEAKERLGFNTSVLGDSEYVMITCLSDCLFRNEYGQPVNYIPEQELYRTCGIKAQLVQQFVQTGLSEGYNAKWQARYPKETTLKAGSVLVYKLQEHLAQQELENAVNKLEQSLSGFRTRDGFGWLGINIAYPNQFSMIKQRAETYAPVAEFPSEKGNDSCPSLLKGDAKKVMSIIRDGLKSSKTRWLHLLCDRSFQSQQPQSGFTLSPNLKVHHYQNMKDIVNRWLLDPKAELITRLLDRDYESDKLKCSIAGCGFKEIVHYLAGDTGGNSEGPLSSYARHMLGSRSGQLYYDDIEKPDVQKTFIAELLIEGLHICSRRKTP